MGLGVNAPKPRLLFLLLVLSIKSINNFLSAFNQYTCVVLIAVHAPVASRGFSSLTCLTHARTPVQAFALAVDDPAFVQSRRGLSLARRKRAYRCQDQTIHIHAVMRRRADAIPRKYEQSGQLALLRRGGIYVIGDMLPFRNSLGWKVMRLG